MSDIPLGLRRFDVYFRKEDGEHLDPQHMNVFADARIKPGDEWPRYLTVVPAERADKAEERARTAEKQVRRLREFCKRALEHPHQLQTELAEALDAPEAERERYEHG